MISHDAVTSWVKEIIADCSHEGWPHALSDYLVHIHVQEEASTALSISVLLDRPLHADIAQKLRCMLPAHHDAFGALNWHFEGRVQRHRTQLSAPHASIRNILVVAAGKGGVGKSTSAVSLAYALKKLGARVGLLDADIYGPSLALMLGIDKAPEIESQHFLPPVSSEGIALMSMANLVSGQEALAWRGPMASKALDQLFSQTRWGDLDYLIVDMPPGTGDIALSLIRAIPVAGALMVSSPSQVACLDVQKATALFKKTHIPLLGIVENMAFFEQEDGRKLYPFGQGHVEELCAKEDIPFWGSCPLLAEIAPALDAGQLEQAFSSPAWAHFWHGVAEHVCAALAKRPRELAVPLQVKAVK